ncbi:hypothetical protein Pint_20489 [Pistacia integerrima]|uniref:Uncharacterized protein n=1 Tax=Pistacia integerrima TaxID=434235 RepID=A0ACC0X9K7_9ROSI|nr:hypothetical protein Pint_20489 [Pistacia integerrima]
MAGGGGIGGLEGCPAYWQGWPRTALAFAGLAMIVVLEVLNCRVLC